MHRSTDSCLVRSRVHEILSCSEDPFTTVRQSGERTRPVPDACVAMDRRTWQALANGSVDLPRRRVHLSRMRPVSPWRRVSDAAAEAIGEARRDPHAAQDLLRTLLLGRTDADAIHRVRELLLDVGIPADFLSQ